MKIFKFVSLCIFCVSLIAAERTTAQPGIDPSWQGTILLELNSADPLLLEVTTGARIEQALSQLGWASGRPQPAERLHWIISMNRQKALVEGRWYQKPTQELVIAVYATSLQRDPGEIAAGLVVTVFDTKADARSYYEGTLSEWISRPLPR